MSTVRDIFESVSHRATDVNVLYPSLNKAVRLIAKRLHHNHSSIIIGSLSVSFIADSSSASLPTDFWGLISRPWINGKKYELEPFPDNESRIIYNSNSVPRWYEVKGTTLHLYPGTSSAITINGDYFQRPTKLTAIDDTVPFNELFDDAIEEYLLSFVGGDPKANILHESVDMMSKRHDKKAPGQITRTINWGAL